MSLGLVGRTDLSRQERVPSDYIHEVMFAVKLLNMDELTRILYDVSDPASENYGKHKTSQEVTDMTSNPKANKKIHEYLQIAGVDIISESLGGEFITAQASVKLWEEMFATEFFRFHQFFHGESNITHFVRAEKYSIPLVLNDCVDSVFHTIQMPSSRNRKPLRANSNVKNPVTVSGEITPPILKKYYNISGLGSLDATQGVYESLSQFYGPTDLYRFQQNFNLNTTANVIVIGGGNDQNVCNDLITNVDNCGEGSLDIQYIMAVAQGSPTTYYG